jgi:SAM-dependent methyltransferase
VVEELRSAGDRRAAARVGRLPVDADGTLSTGPVDDLLVRMHTQLQRLWEELRQGDLAVSVLRPLLTAIRESTPGRQRTLRVVDVGSGLGYFVRWATATGALGPHVEVVGYDLDAVLVSEARRLAAEERLACRFEVGDAFALPGQVDVYVSCGVLHHFAAEELPEFFAGQQDAAGFVHWDPVPTYLASIGAWAFHRARMRDPLARHDGVRSIQRAHADDVLLKAVADGAPAFSTALHGLPNPLFPILDVVRPVIGVAHDLTGLFRRALGPAADRLVPGRGPW